MSNGMTGAVVGVLVGIAACIAFPDASTLRVMLVVICLSSAIIVAAWYLP